MLSQKNLIRILINTAIGLILIFFWVKLININEALDYLKGANLWAIIPFFLLFMVSNILRSWRLKILLEEFKIPLKRLVYLNYLSQLLSFTIPLRVGEVSKGAYLSLNYPIAFKKALVWTFLDRFLDFWVILVMAALLILFIPTNLPPQVTTLIFPIVFGISVGVLVVLVYPKFLKKIVLKFKKIFFNKQLEKYFVQTSDFFIDNIHYLNKGFSKTSLMLLLSFLAIMADGIAWYLVFAAVFRAFLPFLKIMLGSLLSALTFLIPAAPGYIGSQEASALVVYSYGLGLNKDAVSAAAILIHLLTLICVLFFGLMSLYLLKFDLSVVWKKFKK
jgi:uncharacterized protein (TIRG00374 family)